MKEITLEELLEAGCHFGHQVTRHNPKSRDFVFEARDNIHIIDLEKTKEGVDTAAAYLQNISANGGSIIVVGTKRQARSIVEEEITRAAKELGKIPAEVGLFTVTNRWIGGTLTNYTEVAKNYKKLKDIKKRLQDEFERAKYTKKEIGMWEKEKEKLESFYGGTEDMEKLPDAIFVIDSHTEAIAVDEARKMHVPSVALVDTNADPSLIDYPIPANDDAVGSVKLILGHMMNAWVEGRKKGNKKQSETQGKKEDEGIAVTDTEAKPKKTAAKKTVKKTETEKKEEKPKKVRAKKTEK